MKSKFLGSAESINHYSNNEFVDIIKNETKDFGEADGQLEKCFPLFCLKIYWPHLSEEEINDSTDGLEGNDSSIDAFFIDEENESINICQFKSSDLTRKKGKTKKNCRA
ncbi:MAG: hypothetical protein GY782_11905 [Gammaproteobacteria bacterium]|nr:hypothetical protein [Gammaproteobacteria bacterium]